MPNPFDRSTHHHRFIEGGKHAATRSLNARPRRRQQTELKILPVGIGVTNWPEPDGGMPPGHRAQPPTSRAAQRDWSATPEQVVAPERTIRPIAD